MPNHVPRSLHAARNLIAKKANIRLTGTAKYLRKAFLDGKKAGLQEALKVLSTVERIEKRGAK